MRSLLRLGAVFAVLGAIAAVILVFGVSRFLTEEFVRGAVQASIGSDLQFERLELDLFESKLLLVAPTLTDGERFASAERVVLNIALTPLLARALLVDSAQVDGAVLHLVRSDRGIRLVGADRAAETPTESAVSRRANRLAVLAIELLGATLVLEDRTVSPLLRWELRDVNGRANGIAIDAPVLFGLSGELASGGRVEADGESTLDGEVDARIRFHDVSLATAAPYFESDGRFEGWLTGTLDVNERRVELEGAIRDARVGLGDIALRGALLIQARIERDRSPTSGQVELDVTGAQLRYGDFFTKPPGTGAKVVGRVTAQPDGSLTVEKWKFEMSDFEGQAAVPSGAQQDRDKVRPS